MYNAEFTDYEEVADVLGANVFMSLYASRERGTNENTNGQIHQYIPKEAEFSELMRANIEIAENRLNTITRKGLFFNPPGVFLKNQDRT